MAVAIAVELSRGRWYLGIEWRQLGSRRRVGADADRDRGPDQLGGR